MDNKEKNMNADMNQNNVPEDCTHDCSTCGADCSSKGGGIQKAKLNEFSTVKKVIGVVSGKGGVGKSLVTSCLTVMMNRKGYKTAVLDADITGPSIPKSFGIKERAQGNEMGIMPAVSRNETEVMSINLLLDSEEMPVLWRLPGWEARKA